MQVSKLATVIFDLGGVYFTDGTISAIEIISNKYTLDPKSVADIFKGEIGTAYRESRITHDQFWESAKAAWRVNGENIDELAQIWLDGYVPIEGTVKIVEQLKRSGHELLFLSDNVQERVDYLEARYGFLQNFADGVFSHIAGVRKPNPQIYRMVLQKAGNSPENCIYIDDKKVLLEPAKKIGMQTVHFTNSENLLKTLQGYGVLNG